MTKIVNIGKMQLSDQIKKETVHTFFDNCLSADSQIFSTKVYLESLVCDTNMDQTHHDILNCKQLQEYEPNFVLCHDLSAIVYIISQEKAHRIFKIIQFSYNDKPVLRLIQNSPSYGLPYLGLNICIQKFRDALFHNSK